MHEMYLKIKKVLKKIVKNLVIKRIFILTYLILNVIFLSTNQKAIGLTRVRFFRIAEK